MCGFGNGVGVRVLRMSSLLCVRNQLTKWWGEARDVGCVGLVMLSVLVVVRAILGGMHMFWLSCVAMVLVLVVGLASL